TPRPPSSPPFPYTTLFRSTRFEPVVAETTGIMSRFDDDALPQIPVKVSVLHAPAVRPEPVVAFASDTVMRARLSALERASAEYRSEEHTSELQSRENLVCR